MVRQARNGMKGNIYYIEDFSTIKKGEISLYNQLYVGEIYYTAIVVQLGAGGGALYINFSVEKTVKGKRYSLYNTGRDEIIQFALRLQNRE